MGFETKIQWCHHTFNPWFGCAKISEGCAHCYAESFSNRNPGSLGIWGPNGSRRVRVESGWNEPIAWNKKAEKAGERRRVFCASFADVFEDWPGMMVDTSGRPLYTSPMADEWLLSSGAGERPLTMDDVRSRLWWLIQLTPWLDWMILTKRPERARQWCLDHLEPPNLWLGVSVENQATADERIPILLDTPAAVRFVSAEPLLGPIDFIAKGWVGCFHASSDPNQDDHSECAPTLDLVIFGGESGPKARPCDVAWIRSGVEQLAATEVARFVKQLGARPYDSVKGPWISIKGPNSHAIEWNPVDKKGGDPSEWPVRVRVQEMPRAKAVAR